MMKKIISNFGIFVEIEFGGVRFNNISFSSYFHPFEDQLLADL